MSWFDDCKLLANGRYKVVYDRTSRNLLFLNLYGINFRKGKELTYYGGGCNGILTWCQFGFFCMLFGNLALMIVHSEAVISDKNLLMNAISVIAGVLFIGMVQILSYAFKNRLIPIVFIAAPSSDVGDNKLTLPEVVVTNGQHRDDTVIIKVAWKRICRRMQIKPALTDDRIFKLHDSLFGISAATLTIILVAPFVHTLVDSNLRLGDAASLIYPFWLPIDINTPLRYGLVYIFQCFCGIPMQLVMYSSMAFMMNVTVNFYNDFHEIKSVIRKSASYYDNYDNNDDDNNSRREKYYYSLRRDIALCARHHWYLTTLFKEFKSWFQPIYMNGLTWGVVELSILAFSVINGENSLGAQIEISTLMLNMVLFLLFYCVIGEVFVDLNNTVNEAIYDMPWYKLSPDIKKILHIFLSQTSQPLIIKPFGIFPATLEMYTNIMKTAYKYLNLLMAALK